ncbi:MAG: hypothetical protein ACOC4C_04750 [Fibrobacterota bacterium]
MIQILEVALGLFVLYIFLSILLTAVNEAINIHRRGRNFQKAIKEIMKNYEKDFWKHPMIKSLLQGKRFGGSFWDPRPNYSAISDDIIADVIIDLTIQGEMDGKRCQLKQKNSGNKRLDEIVRIHCRNAQWRSYAIKEEIVKWLGEKSRKKRITSTVHVFDRERL